MRYAVLRLALPVWLAGAMALADDLAPEVVQLAHFKQTIREALGRVPNYTCLETVQRFGFEHHGVSFRPLDNVQVEISTVGDKELMAWPGARRFEDSALSDFAAGGMMSTGVFANHARNVFLADTTRISYHGEDQIAGRAAARYDFRVPVAWSGYQIRANGATARVGTQGSFWFDPASLELIRLEVRADRLPPELGIERSTAVIDYARMRIGEADVLLPQSAQLLTTLVTGDARRNDIEFSHCRAYLTESSIKFDMPETPAAAGASPVRQVDLPAGLTLTIELQTAIDGNTAHVGELLTGRVAEDVRRKAKLIVPKGALATGRIRGLTRVSSGIDLTVEFEELEWEGTRAQFYATMPAMESKSADASRIPGTGVLHLQTQFHLPAGFRMTWHTLELNQRVRAR